MFLRGVSPRPQAGLYLGQHLLISLGTTTTRKHNKTMIIISGCPRSGTSLMSSILREVVGAENFHGAKWPQERKLKRFKANATEIDLYVRNKTAPGWDNEDYKDLNPERILGRPLDGQGVQPLRRATGAARRREGRSQGLAQQQPRSH